MAGVVEKVAVKVGQKVSAGDLLCVVSAMKMEVRAHCVTVCCVLHCTAVACIRVF